MEYHFLVALERVANRHHFPPAGVTIRKWARSSNNLADFGPGLALRITVSMKRQGNSINNFGLPQKVTPI